MLLKNQRSLTGLNTINRVEDVEVSAVTLLELAVAASPVGVLASGAGGTSGVLTMQTGHGITTGMTDVRLYWGSLGRVSVTVGTVNVNSVPFSLGSGTVLPANGTSIVMAPRITETYLFLVGTGIKTSLQWVLDTTPTSPVSTGYLSGEFNNDDASLSALSIFIPNEIQTTEGPGADSIASDFNDFYSYGIPAPIVYMYFWNSSERSGVFKGLIAKV